MTDLPQYILDNNLQPQLRLELEKLQLRIQPHGTVKDTREGAEQTWLCSDESGQLFSFTTLEVSDRNVFGLKVGQTCLLLGPREKDAPKRKRTEVSGAFERFEQALLALGAQRMLRSGRS
jgi:hypothetical protein